MRGSLLFEFGMLVSVPKMTMHLNDHLVTEFVQVDYASVTKAIRGSEVNFVLDEKLLSSGSLSHLTQCDLMGLPVSLASEMGPSD